jgi:hypothetical protein
MNGQPLPPAGNGNRSQWWLTTSVGAALIGMVFGAFTTIRTSAERIAVLETQVQDTRNQLRRIEAKLDHLLENGKKR